VLLRLEQLNTLAARWKVAIAEIRETESSFLGFGMRADVPVVLKVSMRPGDEWHSGDVLRAFDGEGTVSVLESTGGAVLLERLDPATELVELVRRDEDEVATRVFADVIAQTARHRPPARCPTVFDSAGGFDRYLANGMDQGVPLALAKDASELYRSLAATQKHTMLLHGDLHHYNVLFDSNRGWVSIDPKGVVGELEYELGAIVRNPVEAPELYLSPEIIEGRLKLLTTSLNLDYRRALQWSFAQAVLSAIWDVEDGFEVHSDHRSLQLAQVIRSIMNEPHRLSDQKP